MFKGQIKANAIFDKSNFIYEAFVGSNIFGQFL